MKLSTRFPFNYWSTTLQPKKMFAHRHDLGWWKMIFSWIILLALVIIPVPVYYGRQTTVDTDILLPKVTQAVKKDAVDQALATAFQNRSTAHAVLYQDKQTIVGRNLTKKEIKSRAVSVSVAPKSFALQEDQAAFKVPLRASIRYQSAKQYLNEQWYAENKSLVTMYFVTLFGGITFVTALLLWLGIAFFMWLTRFNRYTSIHKYKESLNLVLNAMGGGAVLACLVGLVHFAFGLQLVILSLWTVIMISLMFWQTRLNDGYVATGRMQTYD
ncbi:hypothetical protein [Schleiferilactobacillus shenzhenensis]|uniref:Maltodextrose utilization protein MalA n=1 Tax=Schleiferilactobacillus shenzhenensis LY-73 TaxID=1231336 RepID=U4TGR5_9LACO|nr:hypothetical protein [Schleiferilactobacillus shenzhenensis]ERL63976.1 hypothetical protein L248_1719 [Schleiferilactobacillus shenzhenensis LY-73]